MNKTFKENINMWALAADEGRILHRIGSEEYPQMRHATVPAAEVDDWEEIAAEDIPAYTKAQYDAEVERLIAERYSHGKEIEINREATANPERFAEYMQYIADCKLRAKETLTQKGGTGEN